MPSSGAQHESVDIYDFNSENKLIGEVIDNQYRIVSVLGKGGMSVVFKALYMVLNKHVALKMMHAHLVGDTNALLRFKQEAQASSQLEHPNIITVYNFGITAGADPQPYIVMDVIQGTPFSDAIRNNPANLPTEMVLSIFIQTCDAIQHAHDKGVIHRDLKPSNIMLIEKDGNPHFVKIVDFGIAKVLPQEGEVAHRLTQTGDVFGSPTYMSPEQCMGRVVDKRSDIYALGCVLYEALTGQPPHESVNVFDTFNKHINEVPAPLIIPGMDPTLVARFDEIVFKALRKEPEKRYQSMDEFGADLKMIQKDMLEGKSGSKIAVGFSQQKRSLHRLIMSNPKLIGVLGLLVPCVLIGLVWLWNWSNITWFNEKHPIAVPGVSWVSYVAKSYPVRKLSPEHLRKELDGGEFMLKAREVTLKDTPLELLKLWQSRAKFCRELGAKSEEVRARNRVLALMREMGATQDIEYATACEALALLLMDQGEWNNAEALLSKAQDLRERLSMGNADVYMNLGYCQMQLMQFTSARKEFKNAMGWLSGKEADHIGLAVCQACIADTYRLEARPGKLTPLSEADMWYGKAVSTLAPSELPKATKIRERINLYRAFVNEVLGDYTRAEDYYDKAMPAIERLYASHPKEFQIILNNYAIACWKNGDYLKAIQIRNRSKALA